MSICFFLLYIIFTMSVLAYGWRAIVWEVGSVIYLLGTFVFVGMSWSAWILLCVLVLSIVALLRIEQLKLVISNVLFKRAVKSVPKLSKTEEEALNAGDTWLEQDIFTGTPDWQRLASVTSELTVEEQAFLANEVQVLCSMVDEWDVTQTQDLPIAVWDYAKQHGFFGLVIAKQYGGRGFSARAHSDIVMKLASRSGVLAVTVMVPNSLGPGELIQHYGTDEQKAYYLPRLAQGIEIPCFALTEPEAGSDATSITSTAIVVNKKIHGKNVLGLMLTLNKRWITLSPVATLIGLAVHLRDPDLLLQGVGVPGITCLLIARDTEGLEIGNRHLPANQPFMNGTIRGQDIFVPITSIIGGQIKAGHGWQMLVECLSIGRSISLPALAAASSAIAYLTTGAYSRIRRQFNVELAQFEGVQEKIAEIAGLNYLINSTRLLTVAAVNAAKKPSVASAITKYCNTELARIVINNAMDVHAGRAVVVGPRNYLSNFYQGLPISITVEGANIMSRNLLIFGQGSMACHPFIRDEFYAVSAGDTAQFHTLVWSHINYFLTNFAKTVLAAFTGGIFIRAPKQPLKRQYKKLARLSYAFAWLADLSLIVLGGSLKRRERLSARLADALAFLYMAMAALRYAETAERSRDHECHALWATAYCFYRAQQAMIALCQNFPSRIIGVFARILAFPLGQSMRHPSDKLERKLTSIVTRPNDYRTSLKQSVYLSGDPSQPVDAVEEAFLLLLKHVDLYKKVSGLKKVKWENVPDVLAKAVKSKVLTQVEMDAILQVEAARWDAIQVDEFTFESMVRNSGEELKSSRESIQFACEENV